VRANGGDLVGVDRRPAVMDAYHRYEMHWGVGCRLLGIRLERQQVERLAADLKGIEDPVQVRFDLDDLPPKAVKSWQAVARSLWQHVVPSGIADANPLIRTQVLRLTVATMLETFPNSVSTVDPVEAGFVPPATVRRAIAYIDQYAGEDIGLADIAAAAGLGPRALQTAFRRYKGSTPLAHLRAVRLQRANAELREADPNGQVTVQSVAYRWGFGNLGRFADEHRKAFGVSPSQVLRSRTTRIG
jgi:AraC-like DNA-binding protein